MEVVPIRRDDLSGFVSESRDIFFATLRFYFVVDLVRKPPREIIEDRTVVSELDIYIGFEVAGKEIINSIKESSHDWRKTIMDGSTNATIL